jgi:hypothetical protein
MWSIAHRVLAGPAFTDPLNSSGPTPPCGGHASGRTDATFRPTG